MSVFADLVGPGARLAKKWANDAAESATEAAADATAADSSKDAAEAAAAGVAADAAAAAESEAAAQAAAAIAIAGASFDALPTGNGELMPEMFGAIGNGVANDTDAFQEIADLIAAAGGGVVVLRPGAIYLVGRQNLVNNGSYMFLGETILTANGCTKPFIVRGNGAKFKLAPGLRFGTFNAAGTATANSLPYYGGEASAPVPEGIITAKNCTGFVEIKGFEIDGNDAAQVIGGPFGDTGIQLPADGVFLWNNSGGEDVDVKVHHCLRDNIQISGPVSDDATPRTQSVIKIDSTYAARQALSFIGGRGYKFRQSRFNKTGRGALSMAPGAGADLEAETSQIRDLHFEECEFIDNYGAGVLFVGNVARISYDRCTFIGTTVYSIYYLPSYAVFTDCQIAGMAIVVEGGSPSPAAAPKFIRCRFTDDTDVSPTGTTYLDFPYTSIGPDLLDTSFHDCSFRLGYGTPVTVHGGHYHNCSFDLAGGGPDEPYIYGKAEITATGTTFFYGGQLCGNIIYNGTQMRQGSKTWDPGSVADNARLTTTVNVPWARNHDNVIVTFSNGLQGLILSGYVSTETTSDAAANGVVTVTLDNFTGGAVDLASGTLHVTCIGRGVS